MRILNTLYVREHGSSISLRKGTLLVTQPGGVSARVPIESLDAVILLGSARVTTDAIAACADRSISVTSLGRGGRVRFVVGGPLAGNVHLRLAQFSAASDPVRVAGLARWFVAGKLQNYRRLLKRWSFDVGEADRSTLHREQETIELRLQALAGVEDGDRIRGIEGDGTRRYFRCLRARLSGSGTALAFGTRTRRPPRDPVNALLSFLYGLVTTEIAGAVQAVGLDLQIGFLHGVRPGRPSLALDLLEEFRPATADRFAVRLITRRQVRQEHFLSTVGGACYLTDEGRVIVIKAYEAFKEEDVPHRLLGRSIPRWTLASVQATLLARHLRGDLAVYAPHVIDA